MGMSFDDFFAEARRLHLRMLGTPEETRAALDAKDAEIVRLRGIVPETLERLNDELCDENERLHADHWTTLAAAGAAVAASSNVTQEQCVELCAAMDRLSSALMGEAQGDHERMNWLAARHAGIEVEQDDIGVRVTLPRRYGEPVCLEWCMSLRHAIDRAMLADRKTVSANVELTGRPG